MAGTSIRVLLADDHVLVRQGIRQFLEDEEDIEVVAEASDGAEARRPNGATPGGTASRG